MSESLKSVGAITMFVEDREAIEGVLRGGVRRAGSVNEDDVSIAFKFENLIVNLLEAGAAPELIGPAPVATRETGSRFQLTVWVEDTDAVCEAARVAAASSSSTARSTAPGDVRTATFADPDGHIWEVAGKIPS